ncbi:MAG: helix-turn-helix domain-containing protein [Bacillota bacterium]
MVTGNGHYSEYLRTLGKKIRCLREEKGMSQENLSFAAGIHRTYLSDLELGNRNPSIVTLLLIAKALDTTICELVKIDN